MRLLSLRWLIPLTLVVLLLPACGDSADDDTGTTAAAEASTTTVADTQAPTTTTAPTTTMPPTTTTTTLPVVAPALGEGFAVGDAELAVTDAVFECAGSGGLVLCPSGMGPTDAPLTIELTVLTQGSVDLTDMEFWVEDEAGTVYDVSAGLATTTGNGPTQSSLSTFLLPGEMTALTLHFLTDDLVDLSGILGSL